MLNWKHRIHFNKRAVRYPNTRLMAGWSSLGTAAALQSSHPEHIKFNWKPARSPDLQFYLPHWNYFSPLTLQGCSRELDTPRRGHSLSVMIQNELWLVYPEGSAVFHSWLTCASIYLCYEDVRWTGISVIRPLRAYSHWPSVPCTVPEHDCPPPPAPLHFPTDVRSHFILTFPVCAHLHRQEASSLCWHLC